jgi:hypothetical protein
MDPQKLKSYLNSTTQQHKIIGLNARYDRMLDKIGSGFTRTARPTRTRHRSGGSSSVSSYDTPKSSSSAYSRFGASRMRAKSFGAPGFGDPQTRKAVQPLPHWLSDTFASLEPDHPLRLLLPASQSHLKNTPENYSAETLVFERIDPNVADSVFAYQLPEPQEPSFPPPVSEYNHPELALNPLCSPEIRFDPKFNSSPFLSAMLADSKPDFAPFSTPGPTFYEKNAPLTSCLDHVAPASEVEYSNDEESSLPFYPNNCLPEYDTAQEQATTPIKSENESLVHPFASSPSPFYGSHQTRLPTIYFDSPTSDPMSDPPMPAQLADEDDEAEPFYPDLDFIWRPFRRDGTTENFCGPDNRHLGFVMDPGLQDLSELTPEEKEQVSLPFHDNSSETTPNLVSQAEDDCGGEGSDVGIVHDAQAVNYVTQAEEDSSCAFSPAPGVFVSPLGGPAVSHSFRPGGFFV